MALAPASDRRASQARNRIGLLAHDPQMKDAALEFVKLDPGRYGFAFVVAAENQAAACEGLVAALDGEEPIERLEETLRRST